MNTQNQSHPQPSASSEPWCPWTSPIRWTYWIRRLLVCNPFFLVSAALLLFGVNRLSLDANFLGNERENLLFNFGALQVYAGLLTVTAIVLSRRRVWYDSALLVVLEHGLVLVPFILIGQAALIGSYLGEILVAAGVIAVVCRAIAIARWYPQFNLPGTALLMGIVILAANIILPFWFRDVVDTQSVWDWLGPNRTVWLLGLPVLAAGANVLPGPARYGGLNPERPWLPLFIYALWMLASAVHAASLARMANDVDVTLAMMAPLASVVGWTLWNRLTDFVPCTALWMEELVMLAIAVSPLLAWGDQPVLLTLSAANLAAFAYLTWRRTDGLRRLVRHLAIAMVPLVLMSLPESVRMLIPGNPTPMEMLIISIGLCALAYGWRWRHPAVAIVSAIVFVSVAGSLHPMLDSVLKWQLALAVVLCHSLRWVDETSRVSALRAGVAAVWLGTFYEPILGGGANTGIPTSVACGLLVLGEWAAAWWMTKRPHTWVPPMAGGLVLFSHPISALILRATAGIWAIAGSLALFAAGAAFAWNRRPPEPVRNAVPAQNP
ncbi:MAG TPA: hypothetical protein VMF06_16230 [Candidatus Limnocylindria bacterium]|nr:hypothetical protein [Candidatus Limnocylindria bacterium]